jgi:anti-sigma B factor antagonist
MEDQTTVNSADAADTANVMTLTVSPRAADGGARVLDLEGEVDVYTAPQLRTAIMEEVDRGTKHLLINLKRVGYMDSTGLGILIGGVKRLRESGGALLLIDPTPRIARIFEITGLNTIFNVYASEEEALAARAQ